MHKGEDIKKQSLNIAQLIVAIISICSVLIFVGVTLQKLNTVEANDIKQDKKIEDLYKMKTDITKIYTILDERLPAKTH